MALSENLQMITTGVVGLTTTIAAWYLGGRHKARNEYSESITAGTDKIVDTSSKLLEKMEQMLEQEAARTKTETERAELERDHRELCEKALRDHQKQLDLLQREVADLKKND